MSDFVRGRPGPPDTLRVEIWRLINRLQLPFRIGRVVDSSGNCFYDSVIAQLERKELRVGLAERAADIRTHQGLNFTFLYTTAVISILNKS